MRMRPVNPPVKRAREWRPARPYNAQIKKIFLTGAKKKAGRASSPAQARTKTFALRPQAISGAAVLYDLGNIVCFRSGNLSSTFMKKQKILPTMTILAPNFGSTASEYRLRRRRDSARSDGHA